MKKYDEIKFKDLDWYVIDISEDNIKLLLKNVLDEERIKKYSNDDFMIVSNEVRHQDNIRPYEWDKSYIKNQILPEFVKDLGLGDIECSLLSKEEFYELPQDIKECNSCYWLKTPDEYINYLALYVSSSGYVSYNYTFLAFAARPVINLPSNKFLTENLRLEVLESKMLNEVKPLEIKDNKVIGKWENGKDYHYTLSAPQTVIINKVNEIIEVLNSMGDNDE